MRKVPGRSGGIKAARNAGIPVIGISTSHPVNELLEYGCADTINDFNELRKISGGFVMRSCGLAVL